MTGYDPYTGRPNRDGRKFSSDPETQRLLKRSSKNFQKTIPRINNNDLEGVPVKEIPRLNNNDYEGLEGKGNLRPNVLHQFASYNTIFTLSGINEQELKSHDFLDNAPHDIIARTGGIGDANISTRGFNSPTGLSTIATRSNESEFKRDFSGSISILERAHDLFIENVNMISTASPNTERGLGNFTKIEFEIHEPYGVTLIEKVNAATGINGYKDYQDAPLLLTIEFKGFNENGQQVKTKPLVRKIPIGIARVEFDVNEGGARYSLIAVPYPDLGYDDRYKFPRTDVPVAVSTPLDWAKTVMHELNVVMMGNEIEEKKRQLPDVYEFIIDPRVLEYGVAYASNETNATIVANADKGVVIGEDGEISVFNQPTRIEKLEGTAGTTTALTKFFEDAIRSLTGYKDLAESFWVTYLRSAKVKDEILNDEGKLAEFVNSDQMESVLMENQYVNWFKIKTTVETDIDQFDEITRMHPKKIIYQAIPYKIHVLKLITPGVSVSGVNWSKQVHKEYNYIYTGANLDVQNLKINYKTAYYMRNVRGDDKGQAERGIFNWIAKSAQEIFGREKYPEPLKPLRQYPSINKGRSTVNTEEDNPKLQQFYDYLTNPEADMMRIELEILGDPAYLCQDMYMPIHQDRVTKAGGQGTFSGEFESFNSDSFQPIITVNYRIPDDLNDNKGLMFSDGGKTRDEDLFFNGLYQVNKIDSKFDNGQFTQTLHCSRFNNQQGAGTEPLKASVDIGTNKILKTIGDKKADSKLTLREIVADQARDLAGGSDAIIGLDGKVLGIDE
jgi:hypothetical protein